MSLVALVSAGLLAAGTAAVSPRYELSLGAEARHREYQIEHPPGAKLDELELAPALGLEFVAPGSDLTAWYRPRITLANRSVKTAVFHEGRLALSWPLGAWLLTPSLAGSYGTFNLFQLLAAGTQPGQSQALPQVASILAESAQAQLALAGRPAPRYRLEVMLAAYLDGGAGPQARLTLPLQRGLRSRTSLEWQATHLGTLTSTLSGTVAYFSNGPDVAFAVLEEGWRQRLSRDWEVWLGAGGSATQQRRNGDVTISVLPSAEAGARYRFGIEDHQVLLQVAGTLAPAVDRLSGAASQRLGGSGEYRLELGRVWVARAEASGGVVMRNLQSRDLALGGAQVAEPQRRDLAYGGALRIGRILVEGLELDAGVRGYEQRQAQSGLHSYEWVVFLGLSAVVRGKLPAVGAP
jgi:hypothetical protein